MRAKVLRVSPELIVDICKHGMRKVLVGKNAVPSDAEIRRVYVDAGNFCVSIVIESKEYPDVDVENGDAIEIAARPEFSVVEFDRNTLPAERGCPFDEPLPYHPV